ncbi:nuclease-related domain-containing protein [Marinospirillum perlucidum]|uniref:nuclease-related domain-containing protein n=1 Tax=Marinospirillum perlucidum TaxID=1982602 RepID=UPI000DF1BBD7|nr:nuclease-related domain-containing protein [Marinospirillum perlucidum]
MTIIKETDSLQSTLTSLERLAEHTETTNPAIHNKVLGEIKNRRAGLSTEKQVAWLLGKEYRDHPHAVLLNDLRLDMDGDVSQIDHLAISVYGIVSLFETKSFKSGLKVDADGTCWTWRGGKKYEIPSPLRQSQRHESSVRKALEACGYSALEIRHFVLVDYKAPLTKPKKGFENFCRPDRVLEAKEKVGLRVGTTFRALGRVMTGQALAKTDLEEIGRRLARLHQPIKPDVWGRYGLIEPPIKPEEKPALLTSSKLAKALGLTTQELLMQSARLGYAYEKDGVFFATLDAENLGARNCKGRHGPYILWPANYDPADFS